MSVKYLLICESVLEKPAACFHNQQSIFYRHFLTERKACVMFVSLYTSCDALDGTRKVGKECFI